VEIPGRGTDKFWFLHFNIEIIVSPRLNVSLLQFVYCSFTSVKIHVKWLFSNLIFLLRVDPGEAFQKMLYAMQ
jgi:hypothetical protein